MRLLDLPYFSFLTQQVGIDLLYQRTSPTALLDARARGDPPRCMEGTREAIIQEILDWLKKVTKSSSIVWLRGPAGHGKTALEFTIAEICKMEGLLIGSVFFPIELPTAGTVVSSSPRWQLSSSKPFPRRNVMSTRRSATTLTSSIKRWRRRWKR